ncbi:unnamed protein product [Trichogramma brassicae]|uniref:Cytochrome P450 n=1 Tax=Trichogramma brassicae TaxID=86971 RepID=A0A6H5I565_9HYME|nr:unnamed protein product [Trichogramma brassicae]
MVSWSAILLAATALYLVYAWLKRRMAYFEERGIPYLRGVPPFGNMLDTFIRRKHFNDVVQDMYNVNPEARYVGAFDFMRPVIVLRDLELIKDVTIKHFDNCPDHKSFFDDTVDPLFGGNLFNMAGDRWREARSMLSPAFTSSKMKQMFELILSCSKNFAAHLESLPASQRKMVSTKDLFTKYTCDCIATSAFGVSVDSLKCPDNEFYRYGREATNFEGLMMLKFFLVRAVPKLMKIFHIRFISDQIRDFFTTLVQSTVEARDTKGFSRPDMIQLMMDSRGKQLKHLAAIDTTYMTSQAFIFFFGGFDTTSTQMCIIAHELAINEDTVQKRLQEEIDQVLESTNGEPTYEAINAMAYLDAVFNESMRRHTQVGFLDRLCRRSFELPPALPGGKPFLVEPGMNIWVPTSAIHRDPKYYPDPERFDPDRYYEKKVTINDTLNLGFGIGPRSCIGNRFAILETKILLFFLLAKFTLKANEKTSSPMRYDKKTFALKAEGGFWLHIEPRKLGAS